MKSKLMASASSLEGILRVINNYYYSTTFNLVPLIGGVWRLTNAKGDVDGHRVYLSKGRYRWERMEEQL